VKELKEFIKNRASEFGQLEIAKAVYSLTGNSDYSKVDIDSEFVKNRASEYGQWAIADAFWALGGADYVEKKSQEFWDRKPSERGQKEIYDAIMSLKGRITVDGGGGGGEPTLQDVTVKSTKQQQTVTADKGYDGIGKVTVQPIAI